MSLGNRIDTTTQTEYLPYLVDTVLDSNVFFTRQVRAAEMGAWKGRKIQIPVKVSKNSTGQSYSGFDTFSTAATDNRILLDFENSNYQITSSLPGDELAVNANAGENAILNLVKTTLSSDSQDMADDLGTMFYGDGTGNSGKDFLGLGALVDDGSNVATIGGQSRSTYTTLQSTVTASGGNLTLASMDTLWDNVSSGSQVPTIGITTESVFSLYGQLLRPQERITKTLSPVKGNITGSTGFTALEYRGKGIVADEKCTSGYLYFLNEDFIHFKGLPSYDSKPVKYSGKIEGNDYSSMEGLGFSSTDWIRPTNQDAYVLHMYFRGQLITSNPKRHGVLTGITGIA